ncbi:MAG: hypothetical protein WD971_00820, partial [Pirellulales bacterium]
MKCRIAILLLAANLVSSGNAQSKDQGSNLEVQSVAQASNLSTKDQGQRPAVEKVMLGAAELLAGIPGDGPLTLKEIQKWLEDPANQAPLEIELPMWLVAGAGQVKDLKENPMTRAKVELGRQLFFDKRLSFNDTV